MPKLLTTTLLLLAAGVASAFRKLLRYGLPNVDEHTTLCYAFATMSNSSNPVVAREATFRSNYPFILTPPAIELFAQEYAGLGGLIPEPFDIVNHAGNMVYGMAAAIGVTATATMLIEGRQDFFGSYRLREDHFQVARAGITALAVGCTLALNSLTETKWGVKHLPFDDMLGGRTPDKLDTIYSTVYAGLLTAFGWRKIRR